MGLELRLSTLDSNFLSRALIKNRSPEALFQVETGGVNNNQEEGEIPEILGLLVNQEGNKCKDDQDKKFVLL